MIGFNALLRDEGIDPADVKLVRHQDWRHATTPYQRWLAADGRFDLYQKIQRRSVFKGAQWLASFVGTPLNETLFVGIYQIEGVGKAKRGLIDPITQEDVEGLFFYDLVLSSKLAAYSGRLAIEWGEGYRSWFQLAGKKDKAIKEIHRAASEPPFPGFLDFRERLSKSGSGAWVLARCAVGGRGSLSTDEPRYRKAVRRVRSRRSRFLGQMGAVRRVRARRKSSDAGCSCRRLSGLCA